MHSRTVTSLVRRAEHWLPSLQEHRTFPLELQAWTPAELQRHMDTHPACQFCEQRGAAGRAQHFYGGDELFHHMQREHQSCHVCLRRRGNFNYFRNSQDLVQHLRCAPPLPGLDSQLHSIKPWKCVKLMEGICLPNLGPGGLCGISLDQPLRASVHRIEPLRY